MLFACSVTFGKLLRSVVPGPHLCKNGGWARGCAGLRDCSHPPHPRLPERSARGAGVGAGGPLFGPHRSPHPERRSAPWCPGELRPTAIRGRHGGSHFLAFLGDTLWFCYFDLGEIEIPEGWQEGELPEPAMTLLAFHQKSASEFCAVQKRYHFVLLEEEFLIYFY